MDFKKRGERKQVFVDHGKSKNNEVVLEKFILCVKKKTANDVVFLITALKHHFIFSNLSDMELYLQKKIVFYKYFLYKKARESQIRCSTAK